jgi:hypothetical protein
MGVPVITLSGACHAHNVSASLLAAVGLSEGWVASSTEQYVSLAVQHASSVAALQRLRSTLRQRMLASRLCDGAAFVAQLEGAYRGMWERWVREGGRRRPLAGGIGQQQQQQQQEVQQQQQQQQQQQEESAGSTGAPVLRCGADAAGDTPSAAAAAAAAAADAAGAVAGSCSGSSSAGRKHSRGEAHAPHLELLAPGDAPAHAGAARVAAAALAADATPPAGADAAAAPAAHDADVAHITAASAALTLSSVSLQKGRKLSSSCDAAATVHGAAAHAAAAEAQAAAADGVAARSGGSVPALGA